MAEEEAFEDDDHIYFGTAIAGLNQDEPGESGAGQLAFSHGKKSLKAAASRDQVDAVLDERGRPMRFHGAFTGGFSAGYWNTVGSEEGFVPRKFVSSRSQKEEAEAAADAKQKQKQMPKRSQRPEDFMDDEDVSEFGIAPRRLRAREDFAPASAQMDLLSQFLGEGLRSAIPGMRSLSQLDQLVVPVRDSIGLRLLRRLGWRDGHSIGPTTKSAQLSSRTPAPAASADSSTDAAVPRRIGCALPPSASPEPESAITADGDLFDDDSASGLEVGRWLLRFGVPHESPLESAASAPHDTLYGIGYKPLRPDELAGAHSSESNAPVGTLKGDKGNIRGHAFGVGVLNEEAEDMEDIYETGAKLTELNFEVVDPEAEPKSTQKEQSPAAVRTDIPAGRRDVLPGFVKHSSAAPPPTGSNAAATPVATSGSGSTHTHPPAVEKVLLMRVSQPTFRHAFARPAPGFSETTTATAGTSGSRRPPKLTPEERSRVLGDVPAVPAEQSSDLVVQLMSRAQTTASLKPNSTSKADGRSDQQASKPESTSTQSTESSRLKADRYERFISAMRQRLGAVSLRPATHSSAASLAADVYGELRSAEPELFEGLTEWEIEEEREELSRVYALRAAPMERVQSLVRASESRFVSAGRLEDTIRELRSFHSSASPSANTQQAGVAYAANEKERQTADREAVAGWRVQLEWHPSGLVCKRFNVPNPYPDADLVGLPDPNVLRRFRVLGAGDEPPTEAPVVSEKQTSSEKSSLNASKTGPTPNIYKAPLPQSTVNVASSDPLSKLNEMLSAIRNEVSKSAATAAPATASSGPLVGPDRRHSRWDSAAAAATKPAAAPSGFLEPKQPARAEAGAPVVNVTLRRQVRSIFDVLNDAPQPLPLPRAAPHAGPIASSSEECVEKAPGSESQPETGSATAPESEASQRAASENDAAEPKLPEGVDLFRAIFADSDDDDDEQQKPAVAAAIRADAVTKSGNASLEPNSKSGNTETVTSNASPALTGVSNTAEQTASLLSDATSRRAQAQLSQTPIATGCSIAAATSAQTRAH